MRRGKIQMRAQPSLIGYIWLLWNEVIVETLSAPIYTLRGMLSCAARTRKPVVRTQIPPRVAEIARPEPEAGL
jgi:hypothetical protein